MEGSGKRTSRVTQYNFNLIAGEQWPSTETSCSDWRDTRDEWWRWRRRRRGRYCSWYLECLIRQPQHWFPHAPTRLNTDFNLCIVYDFITMKLHTFNSYLIEIHKIHFITASFNVLSAWLWQDVVPIDAPSRRHQHTPQVDRHYNTIYRRMAHWSSSGIRHQAMQHHRANAGTESQGTIWIIYHLVQLCFTMDSPFHLQVPSRVFLTLPPSISIRGPIRTAGLRQMNIGVEKSSWEIHLMSHRFSAVSSSASAILRVVSPYLPSIFISYRNYGKEESMGKFDGLPPPKGEAQHHPRWMDGLGFAVCMCVVWVWEVRENGPATRTMLGCLINGLPLQDMGLTSIVFVLHHRHWLC